MKKRMISMLLVLALCAALLPGAVLAGDESDYALEICGTAVTESNKDDVLGDNSGVSFDPADETYGRTLTLDGVSLSYSGALPGDNGVAWTEPEYYTGMSVIYDKSKTENLTIVLKGKNTLAVKDITSCAIMKWAKDLTITGAGSLTISFDSDGRKSADGIYMYDGGLTITGGAEVTIQAATISGSGYGISVLDGDFTVSGSGTKVTANGCNINAAEEIRYPDSYGVYLYADKSGFGNLNVTGGASLTAVGGTAMTAFDQECESYGILAYGDVLVEKDSTLTVTGGKTMQRSGYNTSYGIRLCGDSITVNAGGHLTAKTEMEITCGVAIGYEKSSAELTLGEPYYWRVISEHENDGELTDFFSSATRKYDTGDLRYESIFQTYLEISPTNGTESGGDDDGSDELPDLGQYGGALIVGGMVSGLLDGSASVLGATFADVSHGAYYYNAVEWAYNKGVAGGVDSKHFAPDDSCTRAQAVTMLWRAVGCPDIYGENPFVDVSESDYYYEAVLWAVAMGITSGTDENHFSPDEPCTRGQIVTFLHREARCYQAHENYGFVDVKTGSYCEDAINWAVSCGITNGTGVDTFSPDDTCTRAQIVTFLYRNR